MGSQEPREDQQGEVPRPVPSWGGAASGTSMCWGPAGWKALYLCGCISRSAVSRSREVILPLSTGETTAGGLCPFLGFSVQEGDEATGESSGKGFINWCNLMKCSYPQHCCASVL